ncbi:ABC transporter permease [Bacillus haynesii]|uniref:ABC transporter permease n=1 Tax=Bacillus haynesii TaxID=1925021 RepID=UPI002282C535|nr:ABC transporter permease [Bacillus haynesii]MCY7911674.1 ABC transporter permease [Bacillus haynesii]MCY7925677.1 ABC transporter permease [Bacillus haynesii]MCY8774136.1 ABC transporter permease [Bacillus haynesii]MCY9445012.1 ABC transporter permease [Bacillus haynesii]MEC0789617.1 ABC transporter permease [Bacillus haynesii]
MLNLIKLEFKKTKLGWYYKGAVIANLCILGLLCLIGSEEKNLTQGQMSMADAASMLQFIGIFVRSVFIVFAGVLIAKLVIGEYKNRTITVMFTYPVSRKKLIAAKLLLIGGLTFLTMIVSELIVAFIFSQLNNVYPFSPEKLTMQAIGNEIGSMLIYAASSTGLSFIPLYFGMRKQSVPATIVSSCILITLISQQSPGFSLASIIYIPISLAVIGIVIAFWSIRKIDREDVL